MFTKLQSRNSLNGMSYIKLRMQFEEFIRNSYLKEYVTYVLAPLKTTNKITISVQVLSCTAFIFLDFLRSLPKLSRS